MTLYALSMSTIYLGVVLVIVLVGLVVHGGGLTGVGWTLAGVGILFLTAGVLGRVRFGKALRAARRALDP